MKIIHISLGGPDRMISVGGRILTFEMHPYCGPVLLKKNGDPAKVQSMPFLKAASLWAQQGQRIDEATKLCIWDHEPEPILKHMGGRHWKVVGRKPAVRGS